VAASIPTAERFSIDATEVTRGQYAAWLANNPSTAGQATVCAWNKSFEPDATCMAGASVCQGPSCAAHPQPCVDMCDAMAYCRAIGRDLCSDQDWTSACTSDGDYKTSYGTTVVSGACNDYTIFGSTTVAVASKPNCHAPSDSIFAGVYDMIGNLEEWVDSCLATVGASDTCKPRGLSFGMGAAAPICSQSTYAERSQARAELGFRCCGR
jgi:formylglycine-generating enzyme required for sulfatase activity